MKTHIQRIGSIIHVASMCLAIGLAVMPADAQNPVGTAVTYSRTGMKQGGELLNGAYDFQIRLMNAATLGTPIGPLITLTNVNVNNGVLPSKALDFGEGAFDGTARWVEVKARQGSAAFQAVGPRQALRPVPLALALPGLRTLEKDESPTIIGGHHGNFIEESTNGSVIAGGGYAYYWNRITVGYSNIGGGYDNSITNGPSVIGGGASNTASGNLATIGGGGHNTASAYYSTIAGGDLCTASGSHAVVGGGFENTASGNFATVPGGANNSASGQNSFAAGYRAFANYNGAFTWADATNVNKFSAGPNTFTVYASGGVYLYSSYSPGGSTTGVYLPAGGGAWSTVSDRTMKANFQAVDSRDVLERVASIPVSTWNYTAQDPSIRHIGPMAQDFYAAFGVGEDERHITTIDADGVLFASVQGLHEMITERDAQIAQQAETIETLTQRLAQLEQAMRTLTAQCERSASQDHR